MSVDVPFSFADLIYLKIEVDRSIHGTLRDVPLQLSGNLQTTTMTGTLLGEYRVVDKPQVMVNLMAGAKTRIDLSTSWYLTDGR